MPPLAGDGVGDVGVVEAAAGCAEHAVERVHQDLDRLGGNSIAVALGLVPLRRQPVEQAGQDSALAAEAGAVGQPDGVRCSVAVRADEAEGVDVVGADEAGIEAFEVEHPDVFVQSGDRAEHVAARLGAVGLALVADQRRRHPAAPVQFR